ncbi:MAG: Na+/H+ antiporter NhaD/arsenite permease-like protein [Myxococcota bacterium]|jgi:Na+/H+ antiporter NhaD/arsenite permease-like protein
MLERACTASRSCVPQRPITRLARRALAIVAPLALLLAPALAAAAGGAGAEAAGHAGPHLGDVLPLWSVVPFAGLLLCIALLPMVAAHWWHHTKNQLLVALAWASPVFFWLLYTGMTDHGTLGHDAMHGLKHAVAEYVSFIGLLGSLYVISGGILLRGDLEGKPSTNTAFLAIGSVLANVIGTTGASMLLIRPMLRTNSERKHTWHIPLFFIFLVSNIGGALTPIGDPPLFLGYLRGIDFWWTLTSLWHIWIPTVLLLLAMFFALDTWNYRREDLATHQLDQSQIAPLRLDGNINFLLLAGVIASVLLLSPDAEVMDFRHYYAREIGMFALTGLSLVLTPRAIREGNDFNWDPILEVAALFIGIFIAMIPATVLLQANGAALGVTEPWQYFWATGGLSAFLDNAPTYVTFAAMACGTYEFCETAENLAPLSTHAESARVLVAVSLGAVFMGAGSYIGNGPNFMVRAIAEQSGYKMPSFFGYCAYAFAFLGPVFVLVTLIWLI